MDQEYETMSPPGSPSAHSGGSSNLSNKQYFCVNISKFVIEIIGSAVFTMMFYMMVGRYSSMLLSLWVITLFGMNISGAHYNPCITLAQMLRRSSTSSTFRKRRILGFMYLFAQLLGGLIGACAIATLLKEGGIGGPFRINIMPAAFGCEYKSWTHNGELDGEHFDCRYDIPSNQVDENGDEVPALPNEERHWKTFQSIVSETFGSFIYVLFFMICTDKDLKYSQDNVKNALVIASSYIASQLMAGGQFVTQRTGPCLNPATALGLAVFQANFDFPQYIVCPFIGCICSVLFYDFVFVKTQEYLNDDSEEEEEEEDDEQEETASSNKKGKNNQKQEVLSDD